VTNKRLETAVVREVVQRVVSHTAIRQESSQSRVVTDVPYVVAGISREEIPCKGCLAGYLAG
jgi:hypothetical protein